MQQNNKNEKQSVSKDSRKADRTLSKALSWILRHAAPKLNLTMSSDGYVPLSAILSTKARNMKQYTENDIRRVVESNDKQRFRLAMKSVHYYSQSPKDKINKLKYKFTDGTGTTEGEEVLCIRANQGHSIDGICSDELLTMIPSDELRDLTIIHGTYTNAWEKKIQYEGLCKMNRNHIHFAAGLPDGDGVISGMRKSCQVHIYIDGTACADDGIEFYRSDNGVILTAGASNGFLPCRYFRSVVDSKTQKQLWQKDGDICKKRPRENASSTDIPQN